MDAIGWTLLKDTPGSWAVRANVQDNRLIVYATDLTGLWRYEKTGPELLTQLKEFNRLIHWSEEKLMEQLFNYVKEGVAVEIQAENDESIVMQLKTVSKLNDRPFVWDFRLIKTSAKEFGIYVTMPMLAMIKNSFEVVEELCAKLISKDRQIDEYKAAGGVASKRALTEDFIKDEYFKKRSMNTIEKTVKTDPVSVFCDVSKIEENKIVIYDQIVSIIQKSNTEMEVDRLNPTPPPVPLPVRSEVTTALGINLSPNPKSIKKTPTKKEPEENGVKDTNKRPADDEAKCSTPSKQAKRSTKLL